MKIRNLGFTLIELLIVIGILATLSVVAVLVINPAEITKAARDSRRLEELASINKTLNIATVQGITFFGTSTMVYVSIPDTSPTCGNLGLPSLPTGWAYVCQTQANYRKVNGDGWIPVNLTSLSTGSPLSVLPIDPINSTSTGNYYTYVTGGSWELTTILESDKYSDKAINDGDAYPGVYSLRSSQSPLTPGIRDKGLIGYWKMDEASGTLYDSSGYGNNGTQSGGVAYGATGKVGNALGFDGVDDYVGINHSASLDLNDIITISFWIKDTGSTGWYSNILQKMWGASTGYGIQRLTTTTQIYLRIDTSAGINQVGGFITVLDGLWHHVAYIINRGTVTIYLDGAQSGGNYNYNHGGGFANSVYLSLIGGGISALLDEVRIYSRALSAAEINAVYNATK